MNELFEYLKNDLKQFLGFDKIYISFIKDFNREESISVVFKNENSELESNGCRITNANFTVYFRFKDEADVLKYCSNLNKYMRTNIKLNEINIGHIHTNNLVFLGIDAEQYFNYSISLMCVYSSY